MSAVIYIILAYICNDRGFTCFRVLRFENTSLICRVIYLHFVLEQIIYKCSYTRLECKRVCIYLVCMIIIIYMTVYTLASILVGGTCYFNV